MRASCREDIVDTMGHEIGDNQIKFVAGRESDFRPGKQIQHGGQIQLQRDCERHSGFLLWLIVFFAANQLPRPDKTHS